MPYILQKDRPFYDMLVEKLVMNGGDRSLDTSIKISNYTLDEIRTKLSQKLIEEPVTSVDGHLNYFLTKLLIRLRWTKPEAGYFKSVGSPVYKQLIELVYSVLKFVYPPKYYNYNRAIGVLNCCLREFHRRYGRMGATIPMMFLDEVASLFYQRDVAPYENKKIIENGVVK